MKQHLLLSLLLLPFVLYGQKDVPQKPMQFIPGGNYAIESGSATDSTMRVQLVLKMDENGHLTITRAVREIDLVSPFHVYMYHNTQGQEEVPEDWKQWVILFDSYKVFEAEDVESVCNEEATGMGIEDAALEIKEQQNYLLLECYGEGKSRVSFPPTIEIGDESYLEAALFVNAKRVTLK